MSNFLPSLVFSLTIMGSCAFAMESAPIDKGKLQVNRPLSFEEAALIGLQMAGNLEVLVLDLSNCSLSSKSVWILSSALQLNARLQELRLSGNPIGDKGAQYISDLIKDHPQLRTVVLDSCNIGDVGAQKLLSALSQKKRLETLSIANNLIQRNLLEKVKKAL